MNVTINIWCYKVCVYYARDIYQVLPYSVYFKAPG